MTRGHVNQVGHEADGKGQDSMSHLQNPVAEICLYGTRQTGAGYIVSIPGVDGQTVRLGTGEPNPKRSFTEAVWAAAGLLQICGLTAGMVHVYEPSGHKFAAFDLGGNVPNFGDLEWVDGGTAFVIPASDVAAAAAL